MPWSPQALSPGFFGVIHVDTEKKEFFISAHEDGNDNPVCEIAKETQMYRTVFWTLWEREVGMIWENGIKTCIISYKK